MDTIKMRYCYGPLIPIDQLPPGAIFELNDGQRAMTTEYGIGSGRCDCYLLDSGSALGSHIDGTTLCREIILYTISVVAGEDDR